MGKYNEDPKYKGRRSTWDAGKQKYWAMKKKKKNQ